MSYDSTAVSALARLLFKAQNELNSLLDNIPSVTRSGFGNPLMNFRLGPVSFELTEDATGAKIVNLACAQGVNEYHLSLVTNEGHAAPKARALLVNKVTGKVVELDGPAIFRGEVPEQFKTLHAEVLRTLRGWLPEAWWAQYFTAESTGQKPQKTPAAAPAESSTATASTPAESPVQEQSAVSQGEGSAAPSLEKQEQTQAATDTPWEEYLLPQQDGPDVRFVGKQLASVRTRMIRGRWQELFVFALKSGRHVAVRHGRSAYLGEVDRIDYKVADTLQDLAEFLGHGVLGKAIGQQLGIRNYIELS